MIPYKTMKIFTVIILSVFLSSNKTYSQQKFKGNYKLTIDVSQINPMPEIVILTYFGNNEEGTFVRADSVGVRDGKAVLEGNVSEPCLATLQTKYFGESGNFILSANNLKIKVGKDITALQIKGSPFQEDYGKMQKAISRVHQQVDSLASIYNHPDMTDSVRKVGIMDEIGKKYTYINSNIYKPYVTANAKKSALSVFALWRYASSDAKDVESLYALLAPSFQKLPTAQFVKKNLEEHKRLAIGTQAPSFTQKDTAGKDVALSSFKGKYVLIDFWASWCHPCREENPHLIHAYNNFKNKNFEIISISLDSDRTKAAWIQAIETDKIGMWTHLSDLNGWENTVAKLYDIKAVPQNFLVDPEGKIIAVGLRGEEVQKKLETILQ